MPYTKITLNFVQSSNSGTNFKCLACSERNHRLTDSSRVNWLNCSPKSKRLSFIRYTYLILPPYTHLDPTTLTFTQRFLEKMTKSQKVPARHPPAGRCWFSVADFNRSLGWSKSQKGQENATLHSTFSNRLAGFCHILECTSPWCHSAELKIKTTSENVQPITVQQGVKWSSVQTKTLSFWKNFLLSQKIHTKTSGDQRFDWKINNFSWGG